MRVSLKWNILTAIRILSNTEEVLKMHKQATGKEQNCSIPSLAHSNIICLQ